MQGVCVTNISFITPDLGAVISFSIFIVSNVTILNSTPIIASPTEIY